MDGPAMISAQTAKELEVVAKFFGIDLEWNKHIFRHAAQLDARAFEIVMRSLAVAVQADQRFGTADRIRKRIESEKASKQKAGPQGLPGFNRRGK